MQGNVALDVARILLRCKAELATTDITDYALDALRGSTIRYLFTLIMNQTDILLYGLLIDNFYRYYIILSSQLMLHVKEGIFGWATGSSTGSLHSKGVV